MPSKVWVTPPEVKAWARGMKDGESHVRSAAAVHWAAAGDVLFSRTQEFVHVISGDLKSSGNQKTYPAGKTVVFEVSYGDSEVDYAVYEIARGGDHDFLGRAVEVSERLFDRAMGLIFETAMEKSRR